MLSSSFHNKHNKYLLFPQAKRSSRSSARKFILILISATAPLYFVATATPAAAIAIAAHHPMQRALFAAPRSFPSFIEIHRLPGTDCRHYHSRRAALVAYPATSAINHNPLKLLASSSSHEMSGSIQKSLMEQLAIRLVQGNVKASKLSPNLVKPMRACVAVAGGGSNAASSIASIPGASSILLESIVTYDRRSFADFVTHNIAQTDDERWLVDMEHDISTDRTSGLSSSESSSTSSPSNQRVESFQFCSIQAAILLSRSSLHRSIQLTPSFQYRCLNCIGVGCTSALVGKLPSQDVDEEKNNGQNGRRSKAYIACSTVRDGTWVWELELDNGSGRIVDIPSNINGRRTRPEEEVVISNVILLAMIRYRELKLFRPLDGNIHDDHNNLLSQILYREGDTLSEKRFAGDDDDVEQSAAFGASEIINGKRNVVAVLPILCDVPMALSHDEVQETPLPVIRMESIYSENNISFPRDILIVPGSFNPPHQGHIGLANAAVSALRRLRREKLDAMNGSDAVASSSSSFLPYSRKSSLTSNASSSSSSSSSSTTLRKLWNAVDKHSNDQYDPTVFFEISVTNADKPPLDPMEVERRVNIFTQLPRQNMPADWAVILTNAPLFSQKCEILAELIPNHGLENRTMSFVLGTDTMVRIINPKYYDNCREKMLAALVVMKEKGIHFIVGGRLEPGTNNFANGENEVTSLPPEIQDMFTLLSEDEFRMDISSTELRKARDQARA
jgi:nicotinic acid mononucleotide adenylyltransferase